MSAITHNETKTIEEITEYSLFEHNIYESEEKKDFSFDDINEFFEENFMFDYDHINNFSGDENKNDL